MAEMNPSSSTVAYDDQDMDSNSSFDMLEETMTLAEKKEIEESSRFKVVPVQSDQDRIKQLEQEKAELKEDSESQTFATQKLKGRLVHWYEESLELEKQLKEEREKVERLEAERDEHVQKQNRQKELVTQLEKILAKALVQQHKQEGAGHMAALQPQLNPPQVSTGSSDGSPLAQVNPMMQQGQQQTTTPKDIQQQVQQQQKQPQQARPMTCIWNGELHWKENLNQDPIEHTVKSSITVRKDANTGLPEIQGITWPKRLIMQLIPKSLISALGSRFFKDAKAVLFHPETQALGMEGTSSVDTLTRVLSSGLAGCVHFPSPQGTEPACDIKVLILLYNPDKKTFLGFIPIKQTQFVDRIRDVIQQKKDEKFQLDQQEQGNLFP